MATAKVALLSTPLNQVPPCLVQAKVHPWFWFQGRGAREYADIRKQIILQRTETR